MTSIFFSFYYGFSLVDACDIFCDFDKFDSTSLLFNLTFVGFIIRHAAYNKCLGYVMGNSCWRIHDSYFVFNHGIY